MRTILLKSFLPFLASLLPVQASYTPFLKFEAVVEYRRPFACLLFMQCHWTKPGHSGQLLQDRIYAVVDSGSSGKDTSQLKRIPQLLNNLKFIKEGIQLTLLLWNKKKP